MQPIDRDDWVQFKARLSNLEVEKVVLVNFSAYLAQQKRDDAILQEFGTQVEAAQKAALDRAINAARRKASPKQ